MSDPKLDELIDDLLAESETLRVATVWQKAWSPNNDGILEGPKARVAAARAAIHEHFRQAKETHE